MPIGIGIALPLGPDVAPLAPSGGGGPSGSALLLEDGSYLLLEDGSYLLLE